METEEKVSEVPKESRTEELVLSGISRSETRWTRTGVLAAGASDGFKKETQ